VSWKTPITLLVLLGVLLGAAYYGWRTIVSPATGSDATNTQKTHPKAHTCPDKHVYPKGQKVRSKQITVNVYNAGSISGLADSTLSSLSDNGFRPGVADNAPGGVSATNVTILAANGQVPQIQLVASQFKGKVAYVSGPALANGIDVVVGDGFSGMDPQAKKYLRLTHAVTTCTPPRP
jgi:hypothetical protein